jgi:hypothetical protein
MEVDVNFFVFDVISHTGQALPDKESVTLLNVVYAFPPDYTAPAQYVCSGSEDQDMEQKAVNPSKTIDMTPSSEDHDVTQKPVAPSKTVGNYMTQGAMISVTFTQRLPIQKFKGEKWVYNSYYHFLFNHESPTHEHFWSND